MVDAHQFDRAGGEQAHAAEFAAVQQHLREPQVVGRGPVQPAAARRPRKRRVRRPGAARRGREPAVGTRRVARGQPMHLGGGHVEGGVDHAQRLEDAFAEELCQRPAGNPLDEVALHVDRDAVRPRRPRLRQQGNRRELVDHRLQRGPGVEDPAVDDGPVHRVARVEHVAQPRGVPHEVAHGDAPPGLDRFDLHLPVVVDAGVDLQVGERGDEPRYRVVELPPSFLVQHHQRRADDRLGHREDAEDGVELHRVVLADVEFAHRVGEDDLPVPRQHGDEARELAVVHQGLHAGVEPLEALGGHPDGGGVGDGEVARRLRPDRGGRRGGELRIAPGERGQRGGSEQERKPPNRVALHAVLLVLRPRGPGDVSRRSRTSRRGGPPPPARCGPESVPGRGRRRRGDALARRTPPSAGCPPTATPDRPPRPAGRRRGG